MWATTVKQALAEGSTKLRLHASEELLCTNMMCDRVGASCLCKLSMALERLRDAIEPEAEHEAALRAAADGSAGASYPPFNGQLEDGRDIESLDLAALRAELAEYAVGTSEHANTRAELEAVEAAAARVQAMVQLQPNEPYMIKGWRRRRGNVPKLR